MRLGFTDRVAEILAASDLLVTKPGPGSLSEAFHQRVPVVVTRNVHTIPQERFNTDFVRDRGLGLVVRALARDPRRGRCASAATPPARAAMRERIAALPAEPRRLRGDRRRSRRGGRASRHHHTGDCLSVV